MIVFIFIQGMYLSSYLSKKTYVHFYCTHRECTHKVNTVLPTFKIFDCGNLVVILLLRLVMEDWEEMESDVHNVFVH
jgi:hypothetical protein